MIKGEYGETKITGTIEEILADMICVISTIYLQSVEIPEKEIFEMMKTAITNGITLGKTIRDGGTEEDFYKVIDKMTECWLSNGELEQYLRPITLFGDNFYSYLNEDWERQETDWQSQYY